MPSPKLTPQAKLVGLPKQQPARKQPILPIATPKAIEGANKFPLLPEISNFFFTNQTPTLPPINAPRIVLPESMGQILG